MEDMWPGLRASPLGQERVEPVGITPLGFGGLGLVGAADVTWIGPTGVGHNLYAAGFSSRDGSRSYVYDQLSYGAGAFAQLQVRKLGPDGSLSEARPLDFGTRLATGDPSGVDHAGGRYLYFFDAGRGQLLRSAWNGAKLCAPEPTWTTSLQGTDLHRVTTGALGTLLLTFNSNNRLFIASSLDGVRFSQPLQVVSSGSMPSAATFGDGRIVFTHQTGYGGHMIAKYSVVSRDRTTGSGLVTGSTQNVHDAFPIARADGGVDLYYIMVTQETSSFAVFRRALSPSGALGPEQRVTDASLQDIMKPQASRLADGSIELTFVAGKRAADAEVIAERLGRVRLVGDAPLR
jgi:hypothetical protein